MRHILVPVDGSGKDGRALAVAADIAGLAGAGVHLLRVVQSPEQRLASIGPLAVLDAAHPVRADVERELESAAGRLRSDVASVSWTIAESGDVSAAILAATEEYDAILLVMATEAPRAVGRMVHGSVADALIRESTRPVVVVPPGASDISGKRVRIRRILVPLDGSHASQHVVDTLVALPGSAQLELILLHVARRERTGGHAMPPASEAIAEGQPPEWTHVQAEQAQRHLDEIATRLRSTGMHATTRVVESSDAARAILEAVRGEPADAIAMRTRGAGGLRRMAHGSVATTVVRESEVPVMLIR